MNQELPVSASIFDCRIRIKNHMDNCWTSWFEGLSVKHHPGGQVTISGLMPDQSAVFGLLNKIRDLNLKVLSISVKIKKEV